MRIYMGKERRLRRIFREDGKAVIVPMDHGVTTGPIEGIIDMQRAVDNLKGGYVDAVVLHKGVAKHVESGNLALIVHLSGSTIRGTDPNWKVCISSVEEALLLGADAVSVHVNLGAEREHSMLRKLGKVADTCDRWQVPLLAMMYPRGPKIPSEYDPEAVAHAARLGAELGADVVKTVYTGSRESFRSVVEACPVPIVLAGGPKTPDVKSFLNMVHEAVEAGAQGVSIGRNVFQANPPRAMAYALYSIVHEGVGVEEAYRRFVEASKRGAPR
ncbi:MAG: 2-amino-3,7-dideoxy-D-threo-hept-6-ulosonate synthase [Candidatus Nezhaarchaeota archaeon]|nr:2-amino-3,7-dideoxy-D-threo-hept-6-ulosonate synthase [Candidatus Nezhaarchaeota archaeon]